MEEGWRQTLILSLQSLGVVYGRLSTAPLYVFGTISTEDFTSVDAVYEYFSFIFWTLTIISLVKYVVIVLEVDDDGEGGTFVLYSLLCRHSKVGLLPNEDSTSEMMHHEGETSCNIKFRTRARKALEKHRSSHYLLLFLALIGACMIIGDGVITPSISVLSASTSLQRTLSDIRYSNSEKRQEHILDALHTYVPVPSACAILVCLFMLQHWGTNRIGILFAPVVVFWLVFIGGVGIYNVCQSDFRIVDSASPYYIYRFITRKDRSWKSLGSILLCTAGSEAMFADLGHFSKRSIKITFICFVYPLLVLCYAGQAAFISTNLHAYDDFNQLSRSMPEHLRHVFVLLSLLVSAVGSQATITASFSIINQCLALGCFPRVKVIHTSDTTKGRVYIPDVNWLIMFLSITITIAFHDPKKIANAAGLAIVFGMVVTTCLMSLVIAFCWEKSLLISGGFLFVFGFVEVLFLSACLLSFHKGAWFLVVLFILSFTSMLAWHYGTMKKYQFDLENKVSTDWLTDLSPGLGVSRVPGIGLIYTDIVTGIPAFFSHFITNLPAFHQILVFVSFKPLPVPYVLPRQRYLVGRVGVKDYRIYRCVVRYGYCDHARDTDDFEEQIIASIGEFILQEETDAESLHSPAGRMILVGTRSSDCNGLVPSLGSPPTMKSTDMADHDESRASTEIDQIASSTPLRRKKVRFMLPKSSPDMTDSAREELQDIADARESGTAYFLGQSHLCVQDGSNFLKKLLIGVYVFLDRNSREPPVALNIPHAALVEGNLITTQDYTEASARPRCPVITKSGMPTESSARIRQLLERFLLCNYLKWNQDHRHRKSYH